jgi:3-oxoacyl-[acyl-carrier protein] reductase
MPEVAGLSGRVALVTGGTKGIGLAVVRRLAEEGASVAFCGRSDSEAQRVAQAIGATAVGTVRGYGVDLTVTGACQALVERASADLGPVEILVNNAAAPVYGTILTLTDAEWEHTINTKVMSYVRCIRGVLPSMLQRQFGRIVNVVGLGGERPSPGTVAVGLVNAGILNMTRAVANQVAAAGVTVNAVSPGMTATERRLEEGPDNETAITRIPLGRMLRPEEVAHAIVVLCGDHMSAVTGAWLQVDGGMITR